MITRRLAAAASLLVLSALTPACSPDLSPPPRSITTAVPLDKDERDLARVRHATPKRLVLGVDHWFVAPPGFRPLRPGDPLLSGQELVWTRGTGAATDAIVVWIGPQRIGSQRAQIRAWKRVLAPTVFTVEAVPTRQQLDGHPVIHLRGPSAMGPKVIDVVIANVNDRAYKIEFNLSSAESPEQRDAIIAQVLKSWHWGAA